MIIPYFGQFKPSITLFLESCKRNKDVDWIFFTDCQIPDKVELSANIQWILTTLEKIHALAETKLKKKVILKRAYKLCDLKPFYGLIFSDYLQSYEYWAYGDTDVIIGRLTYYLEKINYQKFDKINWMGHLCFIKNNEVCNNSVFTSVEGTIDAEEILQNEGNVGFDERDFNVKFLFNQLKIYTGIWAADIDIFYPRMRCVDKKTIRVLLGTKNVNEAPTNYSKQIFAAVHGTVYRIYLKHGKVRKEEFAYIHFRKEVSILFEDYRSDSFLITRQGFLPLDVQKIDSYQYMRELIEKYNNQENYFQELMEYLYQYYRKVTGKRGW